MKLSAASPVACALIFMLFSSLPAVAAALQWSKLPPIPDREGFAWPFAGVSGGALLVAGGANFPDKRPWEGGTKVWYDKVFVLEKPTGQWRAVGKLRAPIGYGVSLQTRDGVLCVGGSDAARHFPDVFILEWSHGKLKQKPLAQLPQPAANACGAIVDGVAYLAGGIATPTATGALNSFYALDLRWRGDRWTALPTWPGPARMLATAGVNDGVFFLFGGAALKAGADGKPERVWLRDAYRFKPDEGWKRIADLPRVAVAAPSPAPVVNGRLLILGGDDGAQVSTPPTEHKGFPRTVLAYDPQADKWETLGEVPFSLVTTPAVGWNGRIVIPGGEARPGVRSTEVWSAETAPPDARPKK
ncbi:MAG: galactose oxidase [Verrucomicrobia bacterium]|nr:galactose oxidase [Verrucomicrobiota bacterium]